MHSKKAFKLLILAIALAAGGFMIRFFADHYMAYVLVFASIVVLWLCAKEEVIAQRAEQDVKDQEFLDVYLKDKGKTFEDLVRERDEKLAAEQAAQMAALAAQQEAAQGGAPAGQQGGRPGRTAGARPGRRPGQGCPG